MPKTPSPYLQHILESIGNVTDFLRDVKVEQFLTNRMVQSAVIRELQIVGEAAGKLEDEFRDSHSNIPWRMVVGMRNRLTHEYWDVDLVKVYNVCQVELMELKKEIETIMETLGK
ncbi:MAG: hypothetical protein ACD_40C00174G0005 [uncultured bacterium]|nr:MAG: hypothetical protein ACD_40C00174G0005 [uncultured bacterium]